MAHFAELDNHNIVKRVIVVNNEVLLKDGVENEQQGIDFVVSLFGGWWKQTSYNKSFRKNYAGIGMVYDPAKDAFAETESFRPFPSWVFNENTCRYESPVAYPTAEDEKRYTWNEETTSWDEKTDL